MSSDGPSATFGSASFTSSSSSSSVSASAATSSGAGSPINLTGNSSLPFSFLITFIAIFLFFLGCGLGSRRVTRQLRRNLGLQITPAGAPPASDAREKPVLWDVYPAHPPPPPTKSEAGGNGPAYGYAWESLSPLSATYARAPACSGAGASASRPEPEPSPRVRWPPVSLINSQGMMRTLVTNPGLARPLPPHVLHQTPPRRVTRAQPEVRWRGHLLPQFLARPLLPPGMHPRRTDRSVVESAERKLADLSPIAALQVSVVIAMPSPENSQARQARERLGAADVTSGGKSKDSVEIEEFEVSPMEELGDYMLGFARVPWAEAIDGQEGSGGKGASL